MEVNQEAQLRIVAAHFRIAGTVRTLRPWRGGGGLVNDSYVVECGEPMRPPIYLLQRVNTRVFPDPARLMENVSRVTDHLVSRVRSAGDGHPLHRTPALIPTSEGGPCHLDDAGDCWRIWDFVPSFFCGGSPDRWLAEQTGRAIGAFQRAMADLPPPRLHEVIPGFHDTPRRYAALEEAVTRDPVGRARAVGTEIEFARRHAPLAVELVRLRAAGDAPQRVVHNDAKVANVLFTIDAPHRAVCVVDLDTVMPGLALDDFGDMMRTAVAPVEECEPVDRPLHIDVPLFEALARGYLSEMGRELTTAERAHLVTAGQVITFEQALRFLADYLEGDVYYKVWSKELNLIRCRNQFALLEAFLRQAPALEAVVQGMLP